MLAKYVITELSNGWVLSFDNEDTYYTDLQSVLEAIREEEKV